jgi:hypothetical protein
MRGRMRMVRNGTQQTNAVITLAPKRVRAKVGND